MDIARILEKDILVKGNPGTSDDSKDYLTTWIDYRVGCDLCCSGEAKSFKTNYGDLRSEEEYFNLKDLKMLPLDNMDRCDLTSF